ncbi:15137_t:CDS:10 [Entrophospora sp. SA101]|nr:15137_t:CDS:10 [Entrophospora sp. SA101]
MNNLEDNLAHSGEREKFIKTTYRSKSWVIKSIELMMEKLLFDISIGEAPIIPSVSTLKRNEDNIVFDYENGIIRRKNENIKEINFLKNTKKFAIFLRVLDICHELLSKNIIATKRDIFYKDVKLFGNQSTVDIVIDELSCLFQIPRSCLNVIASAKGLVAGDLRIYQNNQILLDCSIDSLSNGTLIKSATFQYLLSNRIFQKLGACILITGKGYPDIVTRQLVKILSNLQKKIPILGFFDNDPYGIEILSVYKFGSLVNNLNGIEILSVYKFGSLSLSFDNENLAAPNLRWIGLHCNDRARFNISEDTLLTISPDDRKKASDLLGKNYLPYEWRQISPSSHYRYYHYHIETRGYKKPSTPREFAKSAKKRNSVLSLGSITHLQHFYAKRNIIIKPKLPKNM